MRGVAPPEDVVTNERGPHRASKAPAHARGEARRDVGAPTKALQRCLPRRVPSLELELDMAASRFLEAGLGRGVQVVALEPAHTRKGAHVVRASGKWR